MGRSRYTFHESHYPYFIICSLVDASSLFADPSMAAIILNALRSLQQETEVTLYDCLIIIHLVGPHKQRSRKLKAFKSFTAGFAASSVHWRY